MLTIIIIIMNGYYYSDVEAENFSSTYTHTLS